MPERHPWRSFTEAERAEAVGLALAVGAKEAATRLGISRRTVSSWLLRRTPEIESAIIRSRDDVAARLWDAVTAGTDAVLAGLRDPKARLGDKANALRIVVEAHALISGGPTARTENLNVNADLLDAYTDERREELRKAMDAELAKRAVAALAEDPLSLDRPTILSLIRQIEATIEARHGHG
jgi:hypothetical protein